MLLVFAGWSLAVGVWFDGQLFDRLFFVGREGVGRQCGAVVGVALCPLGRRLGNAHQPLNQLPDGDALVMGAALQGIPDGFRDTNGLIHLWTLPQLYL